jgi:riboflavin biosynthesis pyrimidine reductase
MGDSAPRSARTLATEREADNEDQRRLGQSPAAGNEMQAWRWLGSRPLNPTREDGGVGPGATTSRPGFSGGGPADGWSPMRGGSRARYGEDMEAAPGIRWSLQRERRFPFGRRSPSPGRLEPIGFPPPWEDRPWIFANMVASANGVVAWRRTGPDDDPVLAVLGADDARTERLADRAHMRHLRCFGDVAVGAETLRQQPKLVQLPQEPGEAPAPELYRFREAHGLCHEPRQVIYSLYGCLDLDMPAFNTPGVAVIMVTTQTGDAELRSCGAPARGVDLVVEDLATTAGLRRAHQRLFADRGVRYLDCEGGATVLAALRAAGLLDEVFVTVTDVVVDKSRHTGVQKIFDFEREGAALVAEGDIGPDSAWHFRRWRFNER